MVPHYKTCNFLLSTTYFRGYLTTKKASRAYNSTPQHPPSHKESLFYGNKYSFFGSNDHGFCFLLFIFFFHLFSFYVLYEAFHFEKFLSNFHCTSVGIRLFNILLKARNNSSSICIYKIWTKFSSIPWFSLSTMCIIGTIK